MKRAFPPYFFAFFVVLVLIDQGVKIWARNSAMHEGHVFWPIWPGVFEFKLAYNYGIAFGLFEGGGVFFAPVATIIAGGAYWYAREHYAHDRFSQVVLGVLAAGAVGNLIDRVSAGKVTDMFWVRAINFPVFNVADACITVSAILLALVTLKTEPKPVEPGPPTVTE